MRRIWGLFLNISVLLGRGKSSAKTKEKTCVEIWEKEKNMKRAIFKVGMSEERRILLSSISLFEI